MSEIEFEVVAFETVFDGEKNVVAGGDESHSGDEDAATSSLDEAAKRRHFLLPPKKRRGRKPLPESMKKARRKFRRDGGDKVRLARSNKAMDAMKNLIPGAGPKLDKGCLMELALKYVTTLKEKVNKAGDDSAFLKQLK